MPQVGTLEAKNRLSSLLERVERGEEVTITRHGKPVARLVPPLPDEGKLERAREAAKWIRENRGGNSLGDMSIKDLISEGRR
ncbi:MAG TPA: type II toxin-antitoxin system prevent-host-death family antitoxin [Rhizobiaceae bacterium]|nr:type II toxin-antitoxin system prevent-host-death family antitoxin [Rhizobiaceae bacterium]